MSAPAGDVLSEPSALRQPLLEAIRAGGVTPEQKRDAMLHAMEASGQSEEPWTRSAPATFDAWRRALPPAQQASVRLGDATCFRAGCVAEVRFDDERAYREAAVAFRTLREVGAAHGGRVQTPADLRSGQVLASWIMLRPASVIDDEDG